MLTSLPKWAAFPKYEFFYERGLKDMSEYLGIVDKTVYARLKKMGEEFVLKGGVITVSGH